MQKTKPNDNREKKSANAYLKFLQSKGAPSGILYLRSKFLDAFMVKLIGKTQSRKAFTRASEEALTNLSQEERNNALNTVREFFPFWMNDIKAIALFEEYYGFNINASKWQPKQTSLKALTENLDSEKFSTQENQSLNTYTQTIANLGANNAVIQARTKIAKIILVRLRDAPTINHAIYRQSADLTLPLFKTKEIKQLYLEVMREFYYFWLNDPRAETKVFGSKNINQKYQTDMLKI